MKFGLITEGKTVWQDIDLLKAAGLKTMRAPVFFYNSIVNHNGNILIDQGFDVALNFNYLPTNVPRVFIRDLKYLEQKAERFFMYYEDRKWHIPFIAIENEWDNPYYRDFRSTSIKDYLAELRSMTDLAHKEGYKVADAGITMSGLTAWYYSQLTGKEAKEWKKRFNVPIRNNDFSKYIDLINAFIEGSKSIPFDFLNFHWYNGKYEHLGGMDESVTAYKAACKKETVITNEFGVRNDASLWPATVDEIKSINPAFAIAYSGTNKRGKAIQLTIEQLKLLK